MTDYGLEVLLNDVVGHVMDTEDYESYQCQTTWGHVVEGDAIYFWFCLKKDMTGDCQRQLESLFDEVISGMTAVGFRPYSSITKIALTVGFKSLRAFEIQFKRLSGETPSQYRKRHMQ